MLKRPRGAALPRVVCFDATDDGVAIGVRFGGSSLLLIISTLFGSICHARLDEGPSWKLAIALPCLPRRLRVREIRYVP